MYASEHKALGGHKTLTRIPTTKEARPTRQATHRELRLHLSGDLGLVKDISSITLP